MSLLSQFEAAKHLSSTNTINPSLLCEPINLAENEFKKCFPLLFTDMVENAKNSTPTIYTTYQYGYNYGIGDTVINEQQFYKSLVLNNNYPLEDSSKWEIVNKFNNECFQLIWCTLVKPALAALTAYHAISRLTHQLTNNGLVSKKIDGNHRNEETIDGKYYFERKVYERGLYETYIKDLADMIKNNPTSPCWSKYVSNINTCGSKDRCDNTHKPLGLLW